MYIKIHYNLQIINCVFQKKKLSDQKGLDPRAITESEFSGDMLNYLQCPKYLRRLMKFYSEVEKKLHW